MAQRGRPPGGGTKKEKPKITCIRCGNGVQANFYNTKDKSRKYFGKVAYCKECIRDIYKDYLKKNQNQNLAIYFMCRKIDIPYIHANYEGAIKNITNSNANLRGEDLLASAYMKGIFSFSEANGWGNCFDDSQGEENIDGIASYNSVLDVRKRIITSSGSVTDEYEVIPYDVDVLIQKWGAYSEEELIYLESDYLEWERELGGIVDRATDEMVQQVCLQKNEIRYERENRGAKTDSKVKTLQELLKSSGLLEIQKNASDGKSIGMTIRTIENSRPIKQPDPELVDVDNMKKFWSIFVGGLSRTLGKENKFTEQMDKIYERHGIDIIENYDDLIKGPIPDESEGVSEQHDDD